MASISATCFEILFLINSGEREEKREKKPRPHLADSCLPFRTYFHVAIFRGRDANRTYLSWRGECPDHSYALSFRALRRAPRVAAVIYVR